MNRASDAVASVENLEQKIGDDRKQLNKLGDAMDRFKSVFDKESKAIDQAQKQIPLIFKKKSKDKKKQLDKIVAKLEVSQKKISKARAEVQKVANIRLQGMKGSEKSSTSSINQMIKAEQAWEKSAEDFRKTAKSHANRKDLTETVGVPNDLGIALVRHANDLKKLKVLLSKAHALTFGAILIAKGLWLVILKFL